MKALHRLSRLFRQIPGIKAQDTKLADTASTTGEPTTSEVRASAKAPDTRAEAAQKYSNIEGLDLITSISAEDGMFVGNIDHYFNVGLSALRCIRIALSTAKKERVERILDLPCGHGRVLRILRAAFPEAQLTACDLETSGVKFCAATFGASPVYANEDPARTNIRGPFDLIWCGSLLTHLDANQWQRFLEFFERLLSAGGVLVFTVHGRRGIRHLREGTLNYGLGPAEVHATIAAYERSGFGYGNYPDRKNYGISMSSPSWVLSQLEQHANLRVITYIEEGWDDHQDVIATLRRGYA